jgi:5-(carboxyamino)imidazole ribonucleotide synthase
LGHKICFLASSAEDPSSLLGNIFIKNGSQEIIEDFANNSDVVTYESENTAISIVKEISQKTTVFPSAKSLYTTQHRGREKSLFDKLNIPCTPYQMVNNLPELKIAVENIGLPAMLKTATDGYDGKGQFLIQSDSQLDQAWESMSGVESILEGFVNFKRELSLVAVRGVDNSHEYYPLVENSHHNGILRLTIAPAQNISPKLQQQAESYMRSLLDEMNHVGVLTIELFETDNNLVVNEMAPRVHNSGHWTIEGARTSQFENHIRAITETPLGDTSCSHKYSAMINIIGEQGPIDKALTLKNAHLHLYNKTEREGRKLGHITITANALDDLNASLETLSDFMP